MLLIIGTYFEKAKAALSHYGKVLAAGGIATLYYTSYAAHHIERLQIIDSPLAGGILLTMSAATCLVYALWKKSNITAICSIALAYYGTSINPIDSFSLISGLLLTLTGVILMHKIRSASIGFTSMLGSYLSFIYWQVIVQHNTIDHSHTAWFILGYWLLSAVSTWIPRSQDSRPFNKKQVLAFTSINNGFLILLMSLQLTNLEWVDPLWPVSAIIGSSFLAIGLFFKYGEKLTSREKLTSALARIPFRKSLISLYLMKGIALVTLSICLKLTGPSLALTLTIQSILILIAANKSHHPEKLWFTIASGLILVLSFLAYVESIANQYSNPDQIKIIQHLILAVLYLCSAYVWDFACSSIKTHKPLLLSLVPIAFSLYAIIVSIYIADFSVFNKILLYLVSNLALIFYDSLTNKKTVLSHFCLGSHSLSLVGVFLILENCHTFTTLQLLSLSIIAYAQTSINLRIFFQKKKHHKQFTIYLTIATILLLSSLLKYNNIPLALSIITLLPIAYHSICKKWSQHNLTFISTLGFLIYPICWYVYCTSYAWTGSKFNPILPFIQLAVIVIPIVHLILMKKNTLKPIDRAYSKLHIASAVMLALWLGNYIPAWELSFAVTAAMYHLLNRKHYNVLNLIAIVFYLFSIYFVAQNRTFGTSSLSIYLVALTPLACYIINHCSFRFKLNTSNAIQTARFTLTQQILAAASSIIIWILCSQHLIHIYESAAALSIVWAMVGFLLLSIGFITRDIVFRTSAFIVLGCTVAHVYGVDVWKLNSLLRIFSFITLGVVMLIIGYLYSKKADNDERPLN